MTGHSGNQEPEFGYHDLERSALAFVLEEDSWGDFLRWFGGALETERASDWYNSNPDVNEYRRLWLKHSPDPIMRALADNPQAIIGSMEDDDGSEAR